MGDKDKRIFFIFKRNRDLNVIRPDTLATVRGQPRILPFNNLFSIFLKKIKSCTSSPSKSMSIFLEEAQY
jgi:hypothetical protein